MTFWLLASVGNTFARRVFEFFLAMLRLDSLSTTDEARTATLTVHLAIYPPSALFAEITVLPADTAVTTPFELTLAIFEFALDQITPFSLAFEGTNETSSA